MIYIDNEVSLETHLDTIRKKTILGLDTETNGLDPLQNQVLLIQVGDESEQYVIDVWKTGDAIFEFLEVLESKDISKVMHNAKFDYSFIKSNFNVSLQNIRCTMIGEQLLTAGRKHGKGLAAVCDKYLGKILSKEEQKSFVDLPLGSVFTKDQLKYAADDIAVLVPLYRKIQALLDKRNMRELSVLEYQTISVTADMELKGIFLDKEAWLGLKDKAIEGATKAKKKLDKHFEPYCERDLFGDLTINYNSPKQIQPILQKLTGTYIPSTSEAALRRLSHPSIQDLLKYREHQKRVTTYGDDFFRKNVSPVDQRVHSNFKQLGADSGRYASKNPNMTNIPNDPEYRAAFKAQDTEYKIISADFSGQELRLLAEVSQDPKFLYALENDMDLHCYSASLIYNIPYDDFFSDGKLKADMAKSYRTPAKQLTFGLIYGIGPMKLSANLDIQIGEAKRLMNRYFATFPAIRQALDRLTKQARINKYALSPLDSRRRDLSTFDWDNSREVAHAMNIAKNLPFQGAGASVTKKAICEIHKAIKDGQHDADIINVIHDEILVEVHIDESEDVAKIVQNKMIEAFNYYAPTVPMVVETAIADHWMH